MMKLTLVKILMILLFFCIPSSLIFAQNEANNWYFGTKGGLKFSGTAAPTQNNNSSMNAGAANGEGCSTISDASGNLLFYTDGVKVWDNTHAVMSGCPAGGLYGCLSAMQSAVIVPMPTSTGPSTRFYYIFTVPAIETSELASSSTFGQTDPYLGLNYSIVDMTGNGGKGAVTSSNNRITPSGLPVCEALTAIPHYNGKDFWVMCREAPNWHTPSSTNTFYAYQVSTANVNSTTGAISTLTGTSYEKKSNVGTLIAPTASSSNSQMSIKANSCFNAIAVNHFAKSKLVEVFDFDNKTGTVKNQYTNKSGTVVSAAGPLQLTSFGAADKNLLYGLEFSSNGQYLYVSNLNENFGSAVTGSQLYQFDLNLSTPVLVNSSIYTWTTSTVAANGFGELQLAPNGKIYISYSFNNPIGGGTTTCYLGAINSPNSAGIAANFVENAITITTSGVATKMGLPQFYKGFLAGSGSVLPKGIADLNSVCSGTATKFYATFTGTANRYQWDMNNDGINEFDGAPATYDTVVYSYPTVATVTTYKIRFIATDATCGFTDTSYSTIKVNPVYKPTGTVDCTTKTLTATPAAAAGTTYVWYKDALGTQPFASGTPVVVAASDLTGSNVYVKQVASVTTASVVITPAVPPIASANYSVSTAPNFSHSPVTATSYVTNTITTSVNNLLLNSFEFDTPTDWSTPGSVTYNWRIRSGATTLISGTATMANNGANNGTSTTKTTVSPNYTFATAGTYTVELQYASGDVQGQSISKWPTTLTSPSVAGFFTNTGNGGGTFIHDISITTPAVPGVPAVMGTSYTPTDMVCSNMSNPISAACPLPVNFLYITVDQNRVISWATSREINNDYFIVERSFDGEFFTEIGKVNGVGNTTAISTYSFTDRENSNATTYYRITQVDYDGSSSTSNIVALNGKNENAVSVYPNPNNGEFNITISQTIESVTNIEILDIVGNTVYKTALPSGKSVTTLNLSYFPKGAYFIKASNDNSSSVSKLIIE